MQDMCRWHGDLFNRHQDGGGDLVQDGQTGACAAIAGSGFRGPRGGTLRVIRSQLGRADPARMDKAARLAGVTPAQFWSGWRVGL